MKSRHYCLLLIVLLVGTILRFWNLDFKPLWMDEVITAIFSLGQNYYEVPLDRAVPLSAFESVFQWNPAATCTQIVATVSVQSVHPPLFFCWMHQWLGWINSLPFSLAWRLRSLPAVMGIVAIAASYQLNRVAFSNRAGLAAAALMAVSPFAVYLSQEARHYTLPMVLVILALLGLYQLLTDVQQQRFRPALWVAWILLNSVGFYVHYFFLLAFVGQAVTLMIGVRELSRAVEPQSQGKARKGRFGYGRPLLAIAVVCLTYLPWLPTFLGHMSRPETDWMKSYTPNFLNLIAPLYQLPIGWVLMVIALPVEQQPIWVVVPSVLIMLGFVVWLGWRAGTGVWQLWHFAATRLATQMLLVFIAVVVVQFLAIAFVLGKDITVAPRYNFIYFPAVCALLGASLSWREAPLPLLGRRQSSYAKLDRWRLAIAQQAIWIVLLAGFVSSVGVISDKVFQKPYKPDLVARVILEASPSRLLVNYAYKDFQDVAMGLSFARRLHQKHGKVVASDQDHYFVFLPLAQGYEQVWSDLARLNQPLAAPLDLWVMSPGLKRVGYRDRLTLGNTTSTPYQCTIDRQNYHRLGIPYQRYECR